jgi:hypothetical protein
MADDTTVRKRFRTTKKKREKANERGNWTKHARPKNQIKAASVNSLVSQKQVSRNVVRSASRCVRTGIVFFVRSKVVKIAQKCRPRPFHQVDIF